MSNTKKIFVYGTLMQGLGNNRVLGDSELIGKAVTTDKFDLYASGIPYLSSKGETSRVHGELYEATEEQVYGPIDRLEGHPSFYERRPITVELETGETVEAEAYFCDMDGDSRGGLTLIESGDYRTYSSY